MSRHPAKCCQYRQHITNTVIVLGGLFLLIGCGQVYEKLGLAPDQVADQVAADQQATGQIITQARTTAADVITTIIAGLGALASGILAKWLNTERKITKVLVTGIESADPTTVKETVKAKATAAGVEDALHARVLKYT